MLFWFLSTEFRKRRIKAYFTEGKMPTSTEANVRDSDDLYEICRTSRSLRGAVFAMGSSGCERERKKPAQTQHHGYVSKNKGTHVTSC